MNKNNFLIPLNGLTAGKSKFVSAADKKFFKSFENTEILDASLEVEIVVEKSGQFTGVDAAVKGQVTVECDRCLDPLDLPVDLDIRLSVKYGEESSSEEDSESGREIVFLSAKDADLDLSQIIYDYVCLSLPVQRFHPEGQCNEVVMQHLNHGIPVHGESPQDNPFAALEGMFGN